MTTTDAVKAKPRQTCTDHCSGCDQHFHGLGAFDAHLKRVNERQNHWDARSYQLEHLEGSEAGLESWTENGLCALSFPDQERVTIWRLPLTEADRARLARLANRGEKADSGSGSSRRAPEGVGAGER